MKVGGIQSGDIKRFGKAKVLIHAKSETQSLMLSHLKAETDEMLKEIKPHMDFSYGRGVVFDRDLYEFDEGEILDMCPVQVFHVKKLRGTSLIVLTFNSPDPPSNIVIENERIAVRPFKRKPLQCFTCYKFGHPSATCRGAQLCTVCSSPIHGVCTDAPKCINCGQGHESRDKDCPSYKAEEAALRKSKTDHISVNYAKRLLGHTRTYSQILKKQPSRSQAQQPSASSNGSPVASAAGLGRASGASGVVTPSSSASSGVAQPTSTPPRRAVTPASSLPDLTTSKGPLSVPVAPSGDGEQLVGGSQSAKSPTRGRKRVGMSSPPANFSIPTSNSFEVLASAASDDRKTQTPVANVSKKIRVEVHNPVRLDSVTNPSRSDRPPGGKPQSAGGSGPSVSRRGVAHSAVGKSQKVSGSKTKKS